jgi:hypothetical protein
MGFVARNNAYPRGPERQLNAQFIPARGASKTRTPPKQEKGGALGNPHWHLPGKPEGPGELSKRIGLHSPYSSGNKVTIKHRACFRSNGPI